MSAKDAIYLHLMNQRRSAALERIPRGTWPPMAKAMRRPPIEVWRSSRRRRG